MIKNVIFDIGNVLVGFDWEAHYASFGYSEDILSRLAKATVGDPAWGEYDRGVLSDEDVIRLFVRNDPELEPYIRESLADIAGMLTYRDYAIPWIRSLRKAGFHTYYLSNFSEKALRECKDVMDFVPELEGGIFSCKVRQLKPEAPIYHTLLETYNLAADECVFIDDTPRNITGCEAVGIHGIVFRSLPQVLKDLQKLGVNIPEFQKEWT